MSDYADIMTMSWDELPEPKNLPSGNWLLKGKNAVYFPAKEGSDASPRVVFFYQAVEPYSNVSETEMEALGADYDIKATELSATFWIESNADWKKKVLTHLKKHAGWQLGSGIPEGLKNFRNTEVVAYVGEKQKVDRDTGESTPVNVLSQFVSAEA